MSTPEPVSPSTLRWDERRIARKLIRRKLVGTICFSVIGIATGWLLGRNDLDGADSHLIVGGFCGGVLGGVLSGGKLGRIGWGILGGLAIGAIGIQSFPRNAWLGNASVATPLLGFVTGLIWEYRASNRAAESGSPQVPFDLRNNAPKQ